jgi:photosystem II stability/assembly factor-like uncharacterized protein
MPSVAVAMLPIRLGNVRWALAFIAALITACTRLNTPEVTPTKASTEAISATIAVPTPSPTATDIASSPTPSTTPTPTSAPLPTATEETCIAAQPTWEQVNELLGFQIHDGHAGSDGCQLILVGEQLNPSTRGVVLHSADGGLTVRTVAEFLNALHIWHIAVNNDQIWIAGDQFDGTLLLQQSQDGGLNWTDVRLPVDSPSVHALAISNGKVWLGVGNGAGAILLVSADNGLTWEQLSEVASPAGQPVRFMDVAVQGDIVAAVGTDGAHGFVIVSSDGGATFQRVTQVTGLTVANRVAIPEAARLYVAGYHTPTGTLEDATAMLWRSRDDAETWEMIAGLDTPYIPAIAFVSAERGYAIASSGPDVVILETGDAFETWQSIRLDPQPLFGLEALLVAEDGTVYAVGGGGSGIYKAKP